MAESTGEYGLRDEDRLPWLESVEPDEPARSDVGRTIALVLGGLALIAAVIFGLYTLQSNSAVAGNAQRIVAQEGDYKIKPEDPGGLKVEGEGDSAIATSAGTNTNAAIDLRAVPEAPITSTKPRATASNEVGGTSASATIPTVAKPLQAKAPVSAPATNVPGTSSGGALVQLGAFPSEASANAAWSAIARRFGYVAPLGKSVQSAQINGRTVYRLRVNAGSANAAADLCARLKVAGESCFVTN